MGQELSTAVKKAGESFPSMAPDPALRVTINFAGAPPPGDAGAAACLEEMAAALEKLGRYEPRPAPIREAISKPHDVAVAEACAAALVENVDTIAGWMALSESASQQLAAMAEHCAQNTPRAGMGGTTLADIPSEATALATMLHFCWKFDQVCLMLRLGRGRAPGSPRQCDATTYLAVWRMWVGGCFSASACPLHSHLPTTCNGQAL